MSDKEKLMELIEKWNKDEFAISYASYELADYFIANGVIIQKQGEWVYDHWCEFKCSVCGEFSNSKPYKGKEKYCPNCGAKMKR